MSRKIKKIKQKIEKQKRNKTSSYWVQTIYYTSVWWGARFEHASRPHSSSFVYILSTPLHPLLFSLTLTNSHLTLQQPLELISSFLVPPTQPPVVGHALCILYYIAPSSSRQCDAIHFHAYSSCKSAPDDGTRNWIHFHSCKSTGEREEKMGNCSVTYLWLHTHTHTHTYRERRIVCHSCFTDLDIATHSKEPENVGREKYKKGRDR